MICLVGCKPRFQIAILILEMLEKKYPHCLRYKELEKGVNRRCKGEKPSTATLTKYLNILSGRETQYSLFVYKGVLCRKVEENRNIHYSLTKEFKDSLDRQKAESPITYIDDALSLPQFTPEADDEKAIEIIKHSENEESPEDKKISILVQKPFIYLFIPVRCSLLSISGFIFCNNG